MDDALCVRRRERRRQLPADRAHTVERDAFAPRERREALSLHVLHDDERAAIVGRVDHVVDRRDVGMIEPRGRASFP